MAGKFDAPVTSHLDGHDYAAYMTGSASLITERETVGLEDKSTFSESRRSSGE